MANLKHPIQFNKNMSKYFPFYFVFFVQLSLPILSKIYSLLLFLRIPLERINFKKWKRELARMGGWRLKTKGEKGICLQGNMAKWLNGILSHIFVQFSHAPRQICPLQGPIHSFPFPTHSSAGEMPKSTFAKIWFNKIL
jgi:hypothetical protein